jgi:hypothetical protein
LKLNRKLKKENCEEKLFNLFDGDYYWNYIFGRMCPFKAAAGRKKNFSRQTDKTS